MPDNAATTPAVTMPIPTWYFRRVFLLLPPTDLEVLLHVIAKCAGGPNPRRFHYAPLEWDVVVNGEVDERHRLIRFGAGVCKSSFTKTLAKLERIGLIRRFTPSECEDKRQRAITVAASPDEIDWPALLKLDGYKSNLDFPVDFVLPTAYADPTGVAPAAKPAETPAAQPTATPPRRTGEFLIGEYWLGPTSTNPE